MTSFDTLYKDLLRRSFSDGTLAGESDEQIRAKTLHFDRRALACLLHPEKYPPVLRTASCGEGDCEHACQNSCIFDAIVTGEDGSMEIDPALCTGCAACIEACRMERLTASRDILPAMKAVREAQGPAYVLVAPAFMGQFSPEVTPGKLRSAFKALGFAGMIEVALFADILTLMENTKKPLNKCKLVFCGDTRNNVAYCLMYICAKLGMHYVGWGPKELAPAADVVEYCREVAKETGAVVEYGEDKALLKGADALYTDIWASMGEEDKIPERVKQLTPYKVTGDVMKATENSDCIFLHCLPSFHDFDTTMAKSQMELGYDIREVTDEVFLSPNSKVFDEAENRMHTIKAVMVATIGNV